MDDDGCTRKEKRRTSTVSQVYVGSPVVITNFDRGYVLRLGSIGDVGCGRDRCLCSDYTASFKVGWQVS